MLRRCAAQRGALRRSLSASTQAAEAAPTHLPELDPTDMLGKTGAYVWLRTTLPVTSPPSTSRLQPRPYLLPRDTPAHDAWSAPMCPAPVRMFYMRSGAAAQHTMPLVVNRGQLHTAATHTLHTRSSCSLHCALLVHPSPRTHSQIFHDLMVYHKVEQVFGYPGGAILPVYDAIYNSPHFNFTLPRHEQGGGHMAEGYARATGKPGVCLVTSGPGATNMVTPLQDALMDGTPLIVFTGQVPTAAIGTDAFQEADTVGITRSCTKWNCIVTDIRDLPRRIHEAFYIATSGRPGPVLVDLPKDVTAGIMSEVPEASPHTRMASRMFQKGLRQKLGFSDAAQLDRVVGMMNNAERPVLYVGQGVVQSEGAVELVRKLANDGNIPVTTTLQGMGAFDELSPLSLHMLGMHGSAYANLAMQSADLIVSLGARFDDRVTGNINKFAPAALAAERDGRGGIIHFEISPKNVDKVVNATEAIVGDVAENLKDIVPRIEHNPREEWFKEIDGWKEAHPFQWTPAKGDGAIKPQAALAQLYKTVCEMGLEEDVVMTTGVGQHQMWAAQHYRWRYPRTFITSGGSGTMGFGLPAAIGAQIGMPDKIVIDVDGDASYSMCMQELLTAVEYKVPVKVLILNNHFQGMVRQWQDLFYDQRYSGTKMHNPCFAKVADAMGAKGLRCDKADDLEATFKEFLAHKGGPVVLDLQCEVEEHVYPMVPAGAGLDEMVLE